MVQRTILMLALPGGKSRPKPDPYQGNGEVEEAARRSLARTGGVEGPRDVATGIPEHDAAE